MLLLLYLLHHDLAVQTTAVIHIHLLELGYDGHHLLLRDVGVLALQLDRLHGRRGACPCGQTGRA